MKNLLLASTALVASTAFAMADVDISGNAQMGVFGVNADDDIDDGDLQFFTDIDVTFTMAGETDAGLTFGASIDLDESDNDGANNIGFDPTGSRAFNPASQGGETIFVSGTYGTLTMGDTDGALDFAMEEAIIGSTLGDVHEHIGYNGNGGLDGLYDGQVARYDYTFGDFSFAVSAEILDNPILVDDEFFGFDLDGVTVAVDGDPALGVGFKYAGSFAGFDFGAGLGYQTADVSIDGVGFDADILGVSLDTTVAGFSVILNYTDFGGDLDADHFGIAVGYTFGEVLVAANYGIYDFDDGGEDEGVGLVANYDLGGGAELQAGYSYNDPEGAGNDFDVYSFGINMDF